MAIEHDSIADGEIHEPKGISSALSGEVYVANGAGSGTWDAVLPLNVVIVNSLSDFPTPSGGSITLAANTVYVIGSDISSTDNFIVSNNTKITGNNLLAPVLTYTGTGSMFVGTDVSFDIEHISVTCPTAQVFSISETVGGTKIFQMKDVLVYSCTKAGTFNNIGTIVIENCGFPDADDGFTFQGASYVVTSLDKISMTSTSGSFTGLALGTSVHKTVEFSNLALTGPAGSTGISGAAANANIAANYIASVAQCEFAVTTPLSGITVNDFRWNFISNTNIQDTIADGMVSLLNNATATVIASTSTPVLVAGTWNVDRAAHFTGTAAGRLTYNAERPVVTPLDVTLVVNPASGTNQDIRAYIAKNGSVITRTGKTTRVDSGSPESITLFWQDTLTAGDYIEVFVENNTATINVTVQDAVLRIR